MALPVERLESLKLEKEELFPASFSCGEREEKYHELSPFDFFFFCLKQKLKINTKNFHIWGKEIFLYSSSELKKIKT